MFFSWKSPVNVDNGIRVKKYEEYEKYELHTFLILFWKINRLKLGFFSENRQIFNIGMKKVWRFLGCKHEKKCETGLL